MAPVCTAVAERRTGPLRLPPGPCVTVAPAGPLFV
jgi:hypothetical protein